ncbi:putative defense protein 3 isoform X2 [Trichoplusia ni]|uniref:Defense protein 3 isoform X1 n=1 Tax=Trichoplusia ni TaxID=7111 RepID=A0A7E5WA75_TRINI|nr:putative defense protein 3 isoform X1 [Trichoplusia ni]XP_026737541.1 putative defense protein 3 isoform X2 [Trichoplusia ni]
MLPKFIVGLILCWGVQSFPDGAPIDTCVKNRANQPNHGQHRPQPLSSLPYRVAASALLYGPNTPVTVTIEGTEPFKGFFLQARSVENDDWIGAWEPAPNTTVHPECASITHGDPEFKTRATLLWRAPPDAQGKVYFTGTVLKNYGTFWSNLIAEAPQDPRQLQILG